SAEHAGALTVIEPARPLPFSLYAQVEPLAVSESTVPLKVTETPSAVRVVFPSLVGVMETWPPCPMTSTGVTATSTAADTIPLARRVTAIVGTLPLGAVLAGCLDPPQPGAPLGMI